MRVLNRTTDEFSSDAVYIGRPGPFGNPFIIGRDGDREAVIRQYRVWFDLRVKGDPKFRASVEALRGKDLVCFCSPLACHGSVIVEYLEGVMENKLRML